MGKAAREQNLHKHWDCGLFKVVLKILKTPFFDCRKRRQNLPPHVLEEDNFKLLAPYQRGEVGRGVKRGKKQKNHCN